jgi:hypothetical protein
MPRLTGRRSWLLWPDRHGLQTIEDIERMLAETCLVAGDATSAATLGVGGDSPVSKLLLTLDVGDRTLAMAQRMVHQVA